MMSQIDESKSSKALPALNESKALPAFNDPQRRGRMIVGAVSFIVAGGYTWEAFATPQTFGGQPGPGMWPGVVGVAWIVISLIVVIEALVSAQVGGKSEFPVGKSRRHVIVFFGLTTLMVVLMPLLGTYAAAALYAIGMLKTFSELSWWKSVVYGAVIGVGISWVFIVFLQVRLPLGFIGPMF